CARHWIAGTIDDW
nr:immunoglobulin heavy chain junction region [Macaca mulatta]MOW22777.1 immunoglobulin heavy chain junction region [Macaca mulatta]